MAVETKEKAQTPSQLKAEAERSKHNGVKSTIVSAMEAAAQNQPVGPILTPAANESLETTEVEETDASAALLQVDQELVYILSTPRAHDSKSEKAFCNWLIGRFNKAGLKPELKEEGAIFVRVGDANDSKVLFSCHVDTTHSYSAEGPQKLLYDPNFEHIMLERNGGKGTDSAWKGYHNNSYGGCLGADDGAGVWLMLKMIDGGVKGGYLFHRGEERGCISSHAIASKQVEWLKQWQAAIAFDRPKDFEVIYRQSGVDCASKEYAEALAKEFNADDSLSLKFEASPSGGTTDTRAYRFVIPECINVAVGYVDHHSADETLDYGHLSQLLKRCLAIDWNALPVTRDPAKAQPYQSGYNGNYGYGGGMGYDGYGSRSYPNGRGGHGSASPSSAPVAAAKKDKAPKTHAHATTLEALYEAAKSYGDIMDWFEMDPDLTARCFMMALIEGRQAQIAYNMLLSKTIKP